MTAPSRAFLIRQACLNALAKDSPSAAAGGHLRYWAKGRFKMAIQTNSDWGVSSVIADIRAEFGRLASQYAEAA